MRRHFLALFPLALAGCVVAPVAPPPNPYPQPPPPRVEVIPPPPRPQLVWEPGHWHWNGVTYAWVGGHYVERMAGRRWQPPHWGWRGGSWVWIPGHWV
jgi:hypothetical protein